MQRRLSAIAELLVKTKASGSKNLRQIPYFLPTPVKLEDAYG